MSDTINTKIFQFFFAPAYLWLKIIQTVSNIPGWVAYFFGVKLTKKVYLFKIEISFQEYIE